MDNIPSELTARLSRFEGQVGREDRAAEALLVRGDRTEVIHQSVCCCESRNRQHQDRCDGDERNGPKRIECSRRRLREENKLELQN